MNKIIFTVFLAMSMQVANAAAPQKPSAKPTPSPAVILPVGTTLKTKLLSAVPLDMDTGSAYISRVEVVDAPNKAKLPVCHLMSTATVSPAKNLPLKNYILKPTTLHCLSAKDNKPLPPVRLTGYHVFDNALPELQPPAHATVYLNKGDSLTTILTADAVVIPAAK